MNRISTTLETKELTEAGEFYIVKGYASVFGNKDLDDDVIQKGAFADSLKSRHPQFLWGHDMGAVPIGRISHIGEDHKGLYFEAEMPKDDERVKGQIAPQLRIGSIKGVSIGFRIKERAHEKDGSRLIKTAELFEISLVNVPANPLASVESFKSLGALPYADLPLAKLDRQWNSDDALQRVKEFTSSSEEPTAAFKEAFLYVEPGASDDLSSFKFLIADVIEGRLTAIPTAIFKAATELMRAKGDGIDPSVREALQDHLDRYYARLELSSASKAFAKCEWNVLEPAEREVRLRAQGLSGGLAKALSSGQRDVGRSPRDAGPTADDLVRSLRAIETLAKELSTNDNSKRNTG